MTAIAIPKVLSILKVPPQYAVRIAHMAREKLGPSAPLDVTARATKTIYVRDEQFGIDAEGNITILHAHGSQERDLLQAIAAFGALIPFEVKQVKPDELMG